MVRHPLDSAASKLKRVADATAESAIQAVINAVERLQRLEAHAERVGIPLLTIEFESFVADPVGTTRRMDAFLGLPRRTAAAEDGVRASTFSDVPRPSNQYPELDRFRGRIDELIDSSSLLRSYGTTSPA